LVKRFGGQGHECEFVLVQRLKDFRRIATRYDKFAQNFFSALCFAATLAY